MVITSTALAAGALAGAAGATTAGAISVGLGAGALTYGAKELGAFDFMTPDLPTAPEPEPAVDKGDEGIRRGALKRESRKREIGALYLTRGQRADDATLGGYTQSLGG